jgi:hypothetical protein
MTFRPAHFLTAFVLTAGAMTANATTLTYTFTGDPADGWQANWSTFYDSLTGATTSLYDGGNVSTSIVSFTVDASRYIDDSTDAGTTSNSTVAPSQPWLTSSSTTNGQVFLAMTLNTFGTGQSSFVASDTTYSGVGSLDMFDSLTGDPGTSTYDTQGRITSYHVRDSYNNAFLSGDVSIGVVDGVELPVAIGALDKHYKNYMSLYWYEVFYTYAYDANGSQSYTSSESYQGTSIRIAAVSVTRSDEPVPVPEPSSLALTALALVAFRNSRQRRLSS